MTDDTIQLIELELEDARRLIDDAVALNRLFDNTDFKRLIAEGYFKEEAVRLVEMKAAPAMRLEIHQLAILKDLDGIGCLQQYFNKIRNLADQAKRSMEAGEEEIADIEAEEEEEPLSEGDF